MGYIDIQKGYLDGKLDKQSYVREMFEKFSEVLELRHVIKNSNVSEIKISDKQVVFAISVSSPSGKEYKIDMEISENDIGAVPITVMSFGAYEKEELCIFNIISEWVARQDGVFFDIGANLGWYSLNICKQYSNMTAYAFEPVRETYDRMQRNLILNNIHNCTVNNFGFFSEEVHRNFYYNYEFSGASSLVNLKESDKATCILCSFMRLDDYVEEQKIPRIDFIKCDVEGSELFVFKGGINSIKKYKPIIFSEMLRKWSAKFDYHPNDIIKLLEEIGYQCYVIRDKRLKRFGYVDDDTVETNYFFMHPDIHEDLIKKLTN